MTADLRLSKTLSYVLRHHPEAFGLRLDSAGWVEVDALLTALAAAGHSASREELERVVRDNDKQRFAISSDGLRIRANQGHSTPVQLGYTASEPPAFLFHGTVERFVAAIRADGLTRGQRHHVHLSATRETASSVGARRGRGVVLTVRALAMHEAGYPFFCTANGIWLTDHVPAAYISFPTTR